MDFQASALKWRPQKFSELVGQEHIKRTLSNAILFNRVGHAYLFSGTRGVGKTTAARIFAKSLNCQKGPTSEPCDICSCCEEIRRGNCVDVMEVDGASNNGVAEVRDLIENVQYASSACLYKIFIIDEVHMLSRSAFNALLKTLEEPPDHVVFIFATTELQKIPETILSRCQCFQFKPMTHSQVVEQLKFICEQEGISADIVGLEQIAKNGGGSMRDSQSLLDQVIAFSGKEVGIKSVEAILGLVERDALKLFIDSMANRDAAELISQIQVVVNSGKDLNYFCRDLIEYTHHLLIFKISEKPETLLDPKLCEFDSLSQQAKKFHVDELHQIFTVLARTDLEMKRSNLPQTIFEMSALRLTDVRPFQALDEMIDKISQMEDNPHKQFPQPIGNMGSPDQIEGAKKKVVPDLEAVDDFSNKNDSGSVSSKGGGESFFQGKDILLFWEKVKENICLKKNSFGHFFETCQVSFSPPNKLRIDFEDPFTLSLVDKEENREIIMEAVKSNFGVGLGIEFGIFEKNSHSSLSTNSQAEKKKNSYNESGHYQNEAQIIQDALDIFGGKVIR